MEKSESKPRRNSYSPEVHKEFPELGNEHNRFKVRVVQYKHPYFGKSSPRLDIRKYLENHKNRDDTVYTGFTREGISLAWDDILALQELLPEIIELMDKIPEEKRK